MGVGPAFRVTIGEVKFVQEYSNNYSAKQQGQAYFSYARMLGFLSFLKTELRLSE